VWKIHAGNSRKAKSNGAPKLQPPFPKFYSGKVS